MILLQRWLAVSVGCILAWVAVIGPCQAQASSAGVGAFVGEPRVLSLGAWVSAGSYVLNVGWSTRRDKGADLSATAMFYEGESKPYDRVFTVWAVTGGPRVTFFDNTEYSIIVPATVG